METWLLSTPSNQGTKGIGNINRRKKALMINNYKMAINTLEWKGFSSLAVGIRFQNCLPWKQTGLKNCLPQHSKFMERRTKEGACDGKLDTTNWPDLSTPEILLWILELWKGKKLGGVNYQETSWCDLSGNAVTSKGRFWIWGNDYINKKGF